MEEAIKILHEWEVVVTKEVEETTQEQINGQYVSVTRKVTKPVPMKMALKQPTRRELRKAELFYGKEFNKFVTMGFLPRSIMINKHLDVSGGIMSEKERVLIADLISKRVGLESDLVRAMNETEEVKSVIKNRLVAVNTQLMELNSANESVFSQTAETKAQNQLAAWFCFFLIHVDRNSKWHLYFEGDTFEDKEEFMWKLEEDKDKLYEASIETISLYIDLFSRGFNTPEQFKEIESEVKKQLENKKNASKPATNPVPSTEGLTLKSKDGEVLLSMKPGSKIEVAETNTDITAPTD